MRIYLDLVFLLNATFDFLLLLTVNIILKRRVKLLKVIVGSMIGAFSIFFLFIKLNSFTLFLLKMIISILMIISTFGRKNFFKNIVYLYFVSILLGGFLYYLNLEFSYQNIGLVFFHNGFSINFIFLIILSPIILYLYIKQGKDFKIKMNYYYTVELYYQNKKYQYQAYLDTGNQLYDPYFHKPVLLLYDKKFPISKKKFYIPYQTVEHGGILECFQVDKIIINQEITIIKPFVAISKEPFQIENISMILHPDYF